MGKLPHDFYLNPNVTEVAKQLLGKKLCTFINQQYTSGIITETEAYAGVIDKASHAYNNRLTPRTQTMYQRGGISYVYLCYGIHHLFNVVTSIENIPHAVLVRAVIPTEGIEAMLKRRNKTKINTNLTCGPGAMSQALGITTKLNSLDLTGTTIWIEDVGENYTEKNILSSPRIGVAYAQDHALWPYRFYIKNHDWVSKK